MKDTLFYILLGFIFLVAVVGLSILFMYAPILGIIITFILALVLEVFVNHL